MSTVSLNKRLVSLTLISSMGFAPYLARAESNELVNQLNSKICISLVDASNPDDQCPDAKKAAYDEYDKKLLPVTEIFERKTIKVDYSEQKVSEIYDLIYRHGLAVKGSKYKFYNYLTVAPYWNDTKESVAKKIDALLVEPALVELLTHSVENDLIKLLRKQRDELKKLDGDMTALVKKVSTTETDEDKAKRFKDQKEIAIKKADLLPKIEATENDLRKSIHKMGFDFSDEVVKKLVNTQAGQQEIKLMIISKSFENLVLAVKAKIVEANAQYKKATEDAKVSGQTGDATSDQELQKSNIAASENLRNALNQQYLAVYGLLIRLVIIEITHHQDSVKEILPKLQALDANNEKLLSQTTANAKRQQLLQQMRLVIPLYEKRLQDRSASLEKRKAELNGLFSEVAKDFATSTNVADFVSIVNDKEQQFVNLSNILDSPLFNTNIDQTADSLENTLHILNEVEIEAGISPK